MLYCLDSMVGAQASLEGGSMRACRGVIIVRARRWEHQLPVLSMFQLPLQRRAAGRLGFRLRWRDSAVGLSSAICPGAGIGWPLFRTTVELHGGRLWVESQPGAGSTFWVALPVAPTIEVGAW